MDQKMTLTALLLVMVAFTVLALTSVHDASADVVEETPSPPSGYGACGGLEGCIADCGCGCGGNPDYCGCGR